MLKKAIALIIAIFLLSSLTVSYARDDALQTKARIYSIKASSDESGYIIAAKITEGEYEGYYVDIYHNPLKNSIRNFNLKKGQIIIIQLYTDHYGDLNAYILNISRTDYLLYLLVIFVALALLFGRIKGLSSIISLVISGLIIIKILIPLILNGYNPIFTAVISSSLIVIISFVLIGGFSKKTLSAILGTIGGTVAAGLIANYFVNITSITGVASDDISLLIYEFGLSFDYRGLLMCGIIIGTIGVIMDVSMSITSMVFEFKEKCPSMSILKLTASGIKVGKDIMATMINTLILAYVGTSIPLFLMFISSGSNLNSIFNSEIVSGEIIRSLSGSIGLMLSIPLTAIFASLLANKSKERQSSPKRRRYQSIRY